MRHRSKGRKLGRRSGPRAALRRDVVNALFRHGRITTTLPKAKEFRPWAERMITVAKRGAAAKKAGEGAVALNAYRRLVAELHDEDVVHKLVEEIGPSFADRPGGYTRIMKLAKSRKGDAAPTAFFELVTYRPPEPAPEAGKGAAAKAGKKTVEASG
jgi:large subunit ribosomal protein L17